MTSVEGVIKQELLLMHMWCDRPVIRLFCRKITCVITLMVECLIYLGPLAIRLGYIRPHSLELIWKKCLGYVRAAALTGTLLITEPFTACNSLGKYIALVHPTTSHEHETRSISVRIEPLFINYKC